MKKQTGLDFIANEQKRAREEFGHTAEADLGYKEGELARAGAIYALPTVDREAFGEMLNEANESLLQAIYPFDMETYKPTPKDRIKELSKAGAYIASEIDRLLNEKGKEDGK